ncbi:MAG: YdcH family protein [Sphingorhabdus sp.]
MSALQSKHAELETQLELENSRPHPDDDLIHRLKKQKLQIKDTLEQELAAA